MQINREVYDKLPAEDRAYIDQQLAEAAALTERDPLQGFWPHSGPQMKFVKASTPVQAAFAGNQFGKTTSLVCKSLIQCIPREQLPKRLRAFKMFEAPCLGRIVNPAFSLLEGVLLPAFRQWTPAHVLKGGSFDKAFSKEFRTLHFECGSSIQFMTYEMDLDKFGGSTLHFVGYDEPPPKNIRGECKMRLMRHGGFEMFACTPLKVNTGWMRREIWKNREAPDLTVVKGSIHDNPLLADEEKERALSVHPEWERRAREFGDFLDFGGLIYPEFGKCLLDEPPALDRIRHMDIVVGIDPGRRNAGIIWVGFDNENDAWVFNEGLLQDKDPPDYADFIKAENKRLGLRTDNISYVCDPTARSRSAQTAETVMTMLGNHDIHCNAGQNDHEAGFGQMRTRMIHDRFHVSPECRGLRDEADDYAAKEPDEGKDDSHMEPIKGNDHRLDACRYAVMERPWDPLVEADAPSKRLGWKPDRALPAKYLNPPKEQTPMFMS